MTQEPRTLPPSWTNENGTFTPASAVPAPPAWNSSDDISQPPFPTARRGYEPSAVDAHISRLDDSIAALRSALEESERRHAMAEQHAVAVEEEIRVVRSGMLAQPSPDAGFGARAERLLRLAETEAEQIRTAANRAAAEVTERALGDAERHRHEVRQRLIAESARAEEHANRRAAELKERESALAARLTGARAEVDSIRAAAERAADAERATAKADADELRNRVARELARARDLEERELAKLRHLQDTARLEITRLAAAIRIELTQPHARPSPGPGRGTSRGLDAGRGPEGDGGAGGRDVPSHRAYAEVVAATP
jgi:cell division septum initiation protein DivIVA